jgi:SAM-dependent methyltransferase
MKYFSYIVKRLLFGASKSDFVSYPLFSKPADLKLHADHVRQPGALRLTAKLENGTYKKHRNNCLCGNTDVRLDELISRLDMHAIRLEVLLCRKCGLIRSADVFDMQSNADYYKLEYREIHSGGKSRVEEYFESQLDRGNRFLDILNRSGVIHEIDSIAEIGCGGGGILYPFHSISKKVFGYDYDNDYLEYGRSKGMEMFCIGENPGSIPHAPPDLLILSHVVEHFINPKKELMDYIGKIKPGKYLLVEVPGLFCLSTKKKLYGYPVRYFQIAHVFQFFYREYLEIFYKAFGLEILYGDETATFVLRKPLNWEGTVPGEIFNDELRKYPALVDAYMKEAFFDFCYGPSRENMIWIFSSMLERMGLREAIKNLVRR